jgi:cytochrome c-type biogenesis protein CcmH
MYPVAALGEDMAGAGVLVVVVLLLALVWVFQPVFIRHGNRPLSPGVEEDPVVALRRQQERLLRQLKEWQLEEGRDASGAREVQAGLERELAEVMGRLDRLAVAPHPATALAQEGKNPTGLWLQAVVVAGAVVVATVLLYLGMGYPAAMVGGVVPGNTATAMPDQGAIRSAVARLAQRLEQEPDNLAGWLQLARSQAALEEEEAAKRAYRHILARQPEHVEAAVGLAELLVQSGAEDQMVHGAALLEGVLRQDGQQVDALWLVGALAARAGNYDRAVALWQRLLPLLPAGSESRTTVEMALREARGRLPTR